MKSGKRKGSQYERIIAKFLSKWISNSDELVFWRSPSSGALSTISNVKEVSGDLVAIKPEGEWFTNIFSIEIKTGYPKFDFHKFILNDKTLIEDFWKQCTDDAYKYDKYGLLIFQKKGYKPIIGICDELKEKIIKHINNTDSIILCFSNANLPCVTFYNMNEFFNKVKPEYLKKIKKRGTSK